MDKDENEEAGSSLKEKLSLATVIIFALTAGILVWVIMAIWLLSFARWLIPLILFSRLGGWICSLGLSGLFFWLIYKQNHKNKPPQKNPDRPDKRKRTTILKGKLVRDPGERSATRGPYYDHRRPPMANSGGEPSW